MNTLIRRSCFETNSSSTHSLCVTAGTQPVFDTIYPNPNGNVYIELESFGWEWFKTNDPSRKAAYLFLQAQDDPDKIDALKKAIKSFTRANSVRFVGGGHIDHQSLDHDFFTDFYGDLEEQQSRIVEFIFNKNQWIFGGNDNEYAAPGFYDVPEYSMVGGEIRATQVSPKYVLRVGDFYEWDEAVYFNKFPDEKEIKNALYYSFRYCSKNDGKFFILSQDQVMREQLKSPSSTSSQSPMYSLADIHIESGNREGTIFLQSYRNSKEPKVVLPWRISPFERQSR